MSPPPRPPLKWGTIVAVTAVTAVVVAFCVVLGWWQWNRAHAQAQTVDPEPVVALERILDPATNANRALGRQVSVSGTWVDAPLAAVSDREVDGIPAVIVVRGLAVPQPSGDAATVPVVIGWLPQDQATALGVQGLEVAEGLASVTGFLRGSEAAASSASPTVITGTTAASALSAAELAQHWPNPLYAAVLVSYEAPAPLQPLPAPEPDTRIDFRSAAYAIEWWIFGLFAAGVALRWLRDNGREPNPSSDPIAEVASP